MGTLTGLVVAVVLAGGGSAGLVVAAVAWRRRSHPAAVPLAGMSALPGIAGLCYATAALFPQPPVARWLLATGIATTATAPGIFLLFAIVYTGHREWLTRYRTGAIVGVYTLSGAIGAAGVLVVSGIEVRTVAGLTYPVLLDRATISGITVALSYPAILAAFGLLVSFLFSPRNVYRRQTGVIILAVLFPVVGNVVFEAGFSPHPGLDLTSVFFGVEVVVIALALFRYEFLNVEPLAPDIVLSEIEDPVVVFDDSDTVVDTNPAAGELVAVEDPVGSDVETALPGLLDAVTGDDPYTPGGPMATDGGELEVYDLSETPIRDQYDEDRGTVVVLRNITLLKQRERTLERLQSVSQQFLTADSKAEVFDIAVTAADELLDYPYSGALRYDEDAGGLKPAAIGDGLAAAYEGQSDATRVVTPGDSDIWQVYASGEPQLGSPIQESDDYTLPIDLGGSLLYPLGEHGILGVSAGPGHESFSEDDRRFAEILATSTENALDRVEKEAQLRESRAMLSERNDQIEFFDSVLRHDLRNGLLVIETHAERIAEEADGDIAADARTIQTWSDDIDSLAAKIQSVTHDEPELEPTDVAAALRKPAEKVRAAHESATIDLAFEGSELPPVRANHLLPEVFSNLLTNAIEHNHTDHPTVTVDARVEGESVVVEIADDGPGISDEMKEAVFEKRVTDDDAGTIGFGLYFVATMVERYGGSVRFTDREPDGAGGRDGAVAVVELPVATDE